MKSAKPTPADTPANRRSQPVRQTRTNPPRSSANFARSSAGGGGARDLVGAGSSGSQPIDIYPAITHFADTITALPKELVRHFTLLKEVDAKLFAPEEQLFRLVAATEKAFLSEPRTDNDASSSGAQDTVMLNARDSSAGLASNQAPPSAPSVDESNAPASTVFDPSNVPRRHLFRQTAIKIQEMLVSLEEKNHVISTANEALQRQLARVEDVWPYLESEFSDEAKWGSTAHWAYPENRSSGKASHTERARRDGAAAISAAAQALADEAAARSDARKQAVQAKRNQKNQHHDSDADDHDKRGEGGKKSHGSKARKTAEGHVGLGISATATTNGNPAPKRRKVEKPANGATGGVPMERAISSALSNNIPKAKTNSPRGTPAPDVPKKRKALPSGSGQSKKKNGAARMSPSITSSPVMSALPEPKSNVRISPAPNNAPRPVSARARKNSLQSSGESGKIKVPLSVPIKPNGNALAALDLSSAAPILRPGPEPKTPREPAAPKVEAMKKEGDKDDVGTSAAANPPKKEGNPDEAEQKSESLPPQPQNVGLVTTKSGRASKPSTPALANAQEPARPRSSRNTDNGNGSKKAQKKATSTTQSLAPHGPQEGPSKAKRGDDEEGEIDADEPTYCYCNSVSYGEMVACDADGCEREWFHLACVGLKVAPGSRTKWYCEDCKERLNMAGKKINNR